jgi:excisionase family DNA binding protein
MNKDQARLNAQAIATVVEAVLSIPTSLEAMKAEIAELRRQISVLQAVQPLSIVTVPEAAERLGVTQRTVRRMLRAGRLKSVRIGNRVRVDLGTVQAALLMTTESVFGVDSKKAAA